MKLEKIVYIDGVDFEHELGEASGGVRVYPSLKDAQEENVCWDSCGLVKCKVTFLEWVVRPDWSKARLVSATPQEFEESPELQRLESYKQNFEFLRKKAEQLKARIEHLEAELRNRSSS